MTDRALALEDELGDVLEKAARHLGVDWPKIAAEAGVDATRVQDALDYRSDLTCAELGRLAEVLKLNEVGLCALAQGRYPRPAVGPLPFALHALRMPFGIGVANAYLITAGGDSAVLFDTGASHAELHRAWPAHITRLEAVFVTHYEAEHIGGLDTVMRETELPCFYGPANRRWPQCRPTAEGEIIQVGDLQVRAFQTPGHAPEHNCYAVAHTERPDDPRVLISGDLIFAGSLGGGYFCCQRQLTNARRVLTALPDSTLIAPGHGPLTTVGNERRFNPFLV